MKRARNPPHKQSILVNIPMSKILITDPIHDEGREYLSSRPGFTVDVATGLDEAGLIDRIPGYNALIVRSKTQATDAVIAAGSNLKVIGRAGIGIDNIDVAAATARGVVVFNTPDANATTTAELTIAHILSLSRHLPKADRSVRAGEWTPPKFVGSELAGKTIGIVGFGTIGRLVAERCAGLKMRVLAFDPFVTEAIVQQYGAECSDLDGLISSVDYLTLHCPITDKTRNFINAERIAAMKPGARLINCARGGLVDEPALITALSDGHLAGAALDVFASEPPKDSPLLSLDNVVLTPHLGASTKEAQQVVSQRIAETVAGFLETGEAMSAINLPHIPTEQLNKTKPYQDLAHALGRVIGAIAEGPITELVVRLFGKVAELDPRPITTEALVGLLDLRLAEHVNRVNAAHLAQQQGISIREARSEDLRDYVSLIEIDATTKDKSVRVAGTLLGGSHPRLVRIDDYAVEAEPRGHFLYTRHEDKPGVVGAIGSILGREKINISHMQVGVADNAALAIGLIGISGPLPSAALEEISQIPAIQQAIEINL